jgi:hypothetical protein
MAAVSSYGRLPHPPWRVGGHYLAEVRNRVRAEIATYRSLGGSCLTCGRYWRRIEGGAR